MPDGPPAHEIYDVFEDERRYMTVTDRILNGELTGQKTTDMVLGDLGLSGHSTMEQLVVAILKKEGIICNAAELDTLGKKIKWQENFKLFVKRLVLPQFELKLELAEPLSKLHLTAQTVIELEMNKSIWEDDEGELATEPINHDIN